MGPRRRVVVLGLTLGVGFALPSPSEAIPAFARKHSLSCTACHEAWPKLNDFGRAFRDRGYRLGTGVDEPTAAAPGYWPVSLRTAPGYAYTSTNPVDTDDGPRTVGTGAFEHPEADLLAAGTLGSKASFLLIFAGFGSEGLAQIEAAFARINDLGGSSWLNLKVGKHELDQPRAGHRALTLTQGYLVYGHRPAGEANALGFDLSENQLGVELSGHDLGSRTRYAVSLVSANGAPGSESILSSPTLYGHLSRRFHPSPRGLTQVRVGAFGAVGWWPSAFRTLDGEPLEGTGHDNRRFDRTGAELALWFGPLSRPLALTAVVERGAQKRGLIAGDERDARWWGGFLQVEATPRLSFTAFSRYDLVRNTDQPLGELAASFGDEDALTAGLRYTFDFSSRADVAWHLEGTWRRTRGLGDPDGTGKQVFTGIDFAF